ncbi:DUF5682 family protein [Nocardiopsis flavescens]|uniref:DUF5682 family protein n=1 Tax=Nocardiopsis flavescens TaxID=758803 RepID=UPI001FE8E739|nr:DUF5682 family protein [Nocardiopsis flavescens]
MTTVPDAPEAVLEALAGCTSPYLVGVRHHSPVLAAAVPALLDAADPDALFVELPWEAGPWLDWLAHPATEAPVALVFGFPGGAGHAFYPFADFSPELAALRWARDRGVPVHAVDLPVAVPVPGERAQGSPADPELSRALLRAAGVEDDEELWDRLVEARSYGAEPERVRRAALALGWAHRAADPGGPGPRDRAREAWMRRRIAEVGAARPAAVVGAYHAAALLPDPDRAALHRLLNAATGRPPSGDTPAASGADSAPGAAGAPAAGPPAVPGPARAAGPRQADGTPTHSGTPGTPSAPAGGAGTPTHSGTPSTASTPGGSTGGPMHAGTPDTVPALAENAGALASLAVPESPVDLPATGEVPVPEPGEHADGVVSALIPYTFALLDSRSGYPAGIRDPEWQQDVHAAGGAPQAVEEAAIRRMAGIGARLRADGHVCGVPDTAAAYRLARDLAALRGLPAPGRRELIEALTTALAQGEPLGRARALARAARRELIGTRRGRAAADAPASGLGVHFASLTARLRLPGPDDERRELRLDPERSPLDRERHIALQRASAAGIAYGDPVRGAGPTTDGETLGRTWEVRWTPSTGATLELAACYGTTLEQAARGRLAARLRDHEGDLAPGAAGELLTRAAECGLPDLAAELGARILDEVLPRAGLTDAVTLHDSLQRIVAGRVPGMPEAPESLVLLRSRLAEAAIASVPGMAGAADRADAVSLLRVVRMVQDQASLPGAVGPQRLLWQLRSLLARGGPLAQGAALAALLLLEATGPGEVAARLAGWADDASDGAATARRLTGALVVAAPVLEADPALLDTLTERVEGWDDPGFLTRLPALREGFDALSAAARGRFLDAVTERLGEVGTDLGVPADLAAALTDADTTARSAVSALLPALLNGPATDARLDTGAPRRSGGADPGTRADTGAPRPPGGAGPGLRSDAGAPRSPEGAVAGAGSDAGTTRSPGGADLDSRSDAGSPRPPGGAAPGLRSDAGAPRSPDGAVQGAGEPERGDTTDTSTVGDTETSSTGGGALSVSPRRGRPEGLSTGPVSEAAPRAIGAADRWRLVLGRDPEGPAAPARRAARALDELYGRGHGEGSQDPTGGRGRPEPAPREWSDELEALFGVTVREEVLGRAAERGRADVLDHLDPDSVTPSVDLLEQVLSLAGALPEARLARLRPLVERLTARLTAELARRLRPALTGLSVPRPTRRRGGRLDLGRTVRANLHTVRPGPDGPLLLPERPVFHTRARRSADWHVHVVVDVSGSMERSTIHAALVAAVLHGLPALSVSLTAFSTEVIDFTDRVHDPLSLLLEVSVGGGTDIGAALAHTRSAVRVPSRTIVALITDFEEGGSLARTLAEVRALASSGVHLLGLASLDHGGAPVYNRAIASSFADAGMPVAALGPEELAAWIGEKVRG